MDQLPVIFNTESGVPLYEQLYGYIKAQIQCGAYPRNTKLPSKRRLSAHLQISQNTVQNAYDQLIAEGYILSRPKSGFFVSGIDSIFQLGRKPVDAGREPDAEPCCQTDFSHHGVDKKSFPYATLRRITKEVISENDAGILSLGHSQGDFELRAAMAAYLRDSRGVRCTPHQIVISAGTEFLLQLLILLFHRDTLFALENPGYEKMSLLFKSNRARFKEIPLDESGMDIDALRDSRAAIACVTPSHQFPTGIIMPVNRRLQLIGWANEKQGRYIVEDDYDSEFKFSGKPVPSLQSLDTDGKVIYTGAFSKSLTPAIRISYMVLPESLCSDYRRKLHFCICPVPNVEQKILCHFLNEGFFERHLNKMRTIYKKKRETLVDALSRLMPRAEVSGAAVGLHLLVAVNNGMTERQLVEAARGRGVRVYGLSQYYIGEVPNEERPVLLLGYASIREDEIFKAVELLRQAWF